MSYRVYRYAGAYDHGISFHLRMQFESPDGFGPVARLHDIPEDRDICRSTCLNVVGIDPIHFDPYP